MAIVTRRTRAGTHTRQRAGMTTGPGVRIRFVAFAFLLSLPWAGQSGVLPDHDYAALAKAVIDQVVVPAYAEHAQAAQRLGPVIERHCMGAAAADAVAVHAAFGETMDAWQRAWPFAFGPGIIGCRFGTSMSTATRGSSSPCSTKALGGTVSL